MTQSKINLKLVFAENQNGKKPVDDWIQSLSMKDQLLVLSEIQQVLIGFIRMKLKRNIRSITSEKGLWEIRCNFTNNHKTRVLICVYSNKLVLLHGFIKKSRKTPPKEIAVAKSRMKGLK